MTTVEAFAPAKINLTLHVTGQRSDGHHLLDSLVAFADIGDTVTATASETLSLTIDGPQGQGLSTDDDNLVLRAARLMHPTKGAALRLTKRLPVASGIGGGSSDAAATLRALSALWDCPLPSPAAILPLGADLPVCLQPETQRLRGIGDTLSKSTPLPATDILLVNPGVSVSTPEVFRALTEKTNPPMQADIPTFPDTGALAHWLSTQRNDLTEPTSAIAPEVPAVLAALAQTQPLYRAMSGSGATCFALFAPGTSQPAQAAIRKTHPDWWCAAGRLTA